MKRPAVLKLSVLVATLFVACGLSLAVRAANTAVTDADAEAVSAGVTTDYVIIQFKQQPAASYRGGIPGLAPTKPENGRFNPNSTAARAYLRHLSNVHANYRSWLKRNAREAEIVADYKITFNGMAVKLNKVPPGRAAGGPGVKAWSYSTLHYPDMNVSTGLIGAPALWAASSREDAGRGIQIAIIDSGIQAGHPFFACKSIQHHGPYAAGRAPFGPLNPLPTIIFNHGTHVAGIAAGCVCELTVCDPDAGPITGTISGVAPGATLHDFNVFPGVGAGLVAFGGSAFSHDIGRAIEDAVRLGVDVINMSLGGGVQGPHDFLADFSDGAVDAGVVVCASAGNSGPGDSTVGSPGTGRKVIASAMASNPHFIGIPVTVGATTYGGALGEFNNFAVVTADYTTTSPANGCGAITTDLNGKIALIDRGVCTFSEKIRNAQNRGAIGVLIVNNRAGDPTAMGQDGTPNQPTIPAAMLSREDGNAIKPSGSVAIDGTAPEEFLTANADILQLDSSRGPAPFTYVIKPDVTSPGDNVYSSVFEFGPGGFGDIVYDFQLFRGTSMASPHTAGSAALLLESHPDWSPADIRSALVNTGARVVKDSITGTIDPGVLARGGGRIDLPAADATPLTFDPASVSFGFWSGNKYVSGSVAVNVRNVSGSAKSCTVAVTGPPIVSAPASLSVGAGSTATLHVNLDGGQANRTPSGDYSGDVVVVCDGTTLRIPWFVRINRQGKP
jgi:minor extracellular serine protease Vpr